jgi:uncharacterized FlaG/YvyC family protein
MTIQSINSSINSNISSYGTTTDSNQPDLIQLEYIGAANTVATSASIQQSQSEGLHIDSQTDKSSRIEKAVSTLNHMAQNSSTSVQLEYNKEADRVVMKFVDTHNRELVKQIPSETVLGMDVQIRKVIGVLFDKFI